MSDPAIKPKAERVTKLVDCHVRAEMSVGYGLRFYGDVEKRAKALESACKAFEEFIRDHRSQDVVSLEVVREFKDVCSVCGNEWEIASESDSAGSLVRYCASCGAEAKA